MKEGTSRKERGVRRKEGGKRSDAEEGATWREERHRGRSDYEEGARSEEEEGAGESILTSVKEALSIYIGR